MANKTIKKKQKLEGLRVRGTFKVWGSTFDVGRKGQCRYVFSTSVGQKNDADEWDNLYIDVVFPKEDKIAFEGGAIVNVGDGFVTFYTSRSGEKKVKVVLLDYDFIEEE